MANSWGGADPVEVVDGSDYELGTQWRALVDITLTHARIFTGAGEISIGSRRARVWTTAGVQLGIATCDSDIPTGWSNWEYDSPVEILAGTAFITSHMTGGNYAVTANAFDANVSSVDGNVVGVRTVDSVNGNGIFNGTPGSFPATGSGPHHFYGSAFVYTLGIGGNTAPNIDSTVVTVLSAEATVAVGVSDAETLVGATLRFDWGDGTPDTQVTYPIVSASHIYSLDGNYPVLITLTDASGLTDVKAVVAQVVIPPSGFLSNNLTEQIIQRRITDQFIAANPFQLVLTPVALVKGPTGAREKTPQTPRVEQTFRLIPYGETYRSTPTDDGKEREYEFILLGSWDSLMEVGDFWIDDNGARLEIMEKVPVTPLNYETRGYVVKHGKN